ncbi:thioredoxin-2 isoform X1 [Macrosteles quadrilineatus]|uniref:thioredoxin-2 isoform X1 n=1 Tax=Macrosteles quadrilineatus TaxID=74068 RepID=UPI0023E19BDD|nr:thioredoxin-2 isoform X1 [Macrosteles quadrilineatus]
MSAKAVHITDEEDLKTKLKEAGDNLVVIDFFATWCGPCKMISPKIEEMAAEMQDVVFLKVDVDECESIAGEYNVSSMPTFVFIKKGERVDSFAGANYDKLKETVTKYK